MSETTPPQSRAALALLAPTTSGTRSLVVGRHGHRLAEAIRGFRGDATFLLPPTRPPPDAERPGWAPAGTGGGCLPFDADSFHAIFLDGSPGAVEGELALEAQGEAGKALLRECMRILQPGGSVVMAAPNRFGVHRLRPRRIRGMLGGRSPLAHARSSAGYARLLQGAGFHEPELHCPWPSHESLRLLISYAGAPSGRTGRTLDPGALVGREGEHPAMSALTGLLRVLGPRLWLFSCLYVVARSPTEDGERRRPSPLESLLLDPAFSEASPDSEDESARHPTLAYRPQSTTVLARVGDRMAKIPLFPSMVKRLRREVMAVRRLKPRLGRNVPDDMMLRERSGFVYAVSRRVSSDTSLRPEVRIEKAFAALFRDTEQGSPMETDVWRRFVALDDRGVWASLGVPDLLQALAARVEGARLPVGILHGDLKPANIMSRGGDVVLIDWDGYDPRAPLVLDAIHAVATHLEERDGVTPGLDPRTSSLSRIREGDPSVPFLDDIRRLQGDLRAEEAICVYAMHYVSRGARILASHGPRSDFAQRMRERLHFSRRLLRDAPEVTSIGGGTR